MGDRLTDPGRADAAGRSWNDAKERRLSSEKKPRLTIGHVSVVFGDEHALRDVSLAVHSGEVHALLGQNGAGKSSLVKVIAGYYAPTQGASIKVDGVEVFAGRPYSPPEAYTAGFRFVHQNLNLVPSLDAVENVALRAGYEVGNLGRIQWRRTRNSITQWVSRQLGHEFDLDVPVEKLSSIDQVLVAIARALFARSQEETKILVLDEVTTGLPEEELVRIDGLVKRIKERGQSVIYISHILEEVHRICDRFTVLRDGKVVLSGSVHDTSQSTLVEAILGRRSGSTSPTSSTSLAPLDMGPLILRAEHLRGGLARDVSLKVHAGEIIGITGGVGCGKSAVGRLLFGAQRRVSGRVLVETGSDGFAHRDVTSPPQSLLSGIGYIPEHGAYLTTLSVKENLSLTNFSHCWKGGWLSSRRELKKVLEWMQEFDVRPRDPNRPLGLFSGGNRQKTVLAKWMRLQLKVLILDEPTQGVDVGAKADIHELLKRASERGAGIILISSDYREIASLCNRVIVMKDGLIADIIQGSDISASRLQESVLAGPQTLVMSRRKNG